MIVAVFHALGTLPLLQVLLYRMRRAVLPLLLMFFNISLCTLSGPGAFLFSSRLIALSSSAGVIRFEKISGIVSLSLVSSSCRFFFNTLSRSVLLSAFVTFARNLLRCSAFLLSVTIVVPSDEKGLGFSWLFLPDIFPSSFQASLPLC